MILSKISIYGVLSSPNKVIVNGQTGGYNFSYDSQFHVIVTIFDINFF